MPIYISVTEGLRMIGQSVLDYLSTPFIWAKDIITMVWNFIRSLFKSLAGSFTSFGNQMLSVLMRYRLFKLYRAFLPESPRSLTTVS